MSEHSLRMARDVTVWHDVRDASRHADVDMNSIDIVTWLVRRKQRLLPTAMKCDVWRPSTALVMVTAMIEEDHADESPRLIANGELPFRKGRSGCHCCGPIFLN
jgi:hypothetical protein